MKLTASMIQGIQAPFSKPERNKVSSPCYCFHQIVLVYILIANLHSSRSQFQEYCPDRPPTIVQMSCGPPYQTQCIMSDWVCDSRPDCPNGADESNATCNAVRGLPSVSACDIQPCNNGATCSHFSRQDTVVVAYYRCTCAPGFTGDNCEFGSPGTTQSSNVPTTATLTTTIIRSQETTTLRMTTISMKSAAIKAETTTEPSPTTAGDVSNQKTTFTTSDPLTPSETTQLSTFDATSQSHGTTTSPKSTTLPATTSSSSIPMTTTQAITNQLVSVAVTTSSLPSVDGSVCEPSPCVNGVCTPLRNGYHCSCFTGYSGSTCLRMTNPCASQPCQNSISCYILNGEFSCVCRTGFTGRQCDVKMFDCKSFPCKNGGSCIEGSSRFHCECMKGFEGTYCEENINDCASAPCQHGGTCRDGIGFYTCRCSKDRAGENCQRPQNCLDGDPCLNHGVCHHTSSLSPLKRCYCLPGFTGTLCEENVNECLSSPCGQNGKCMDGINSYTCDCHPGYTGEHCETNVDYCSPNPCQNGGQCCNRNGRCFYLTTDFECYCPRGFTGALCEVQASACYSNPCINGGVCKQNGNSYTCTCPLTFSGSQCQVNEPCASAPCIGDGTCQNNASGFICHCSQDFYGTYCEHPQPCYNKPCQNQGTCVDLENAYACQCGSNFTGIHCEFLQPCAPQPCQNGGQCENIDLVQYKCHCLEDYTGVNCENPLGCSSNPCMNNGDCSNRGLQDFTCACTYEYYGDRCQTFSPCSSLPCQNTGSCSDVSESNYSCACPQDFTGRNCESVIPCSLQPCQNNGVCTDIGVTGYTCLCQPDNTGANCESILPCSLAPCLNGASCTDVQDGGYECQCTSNYTGVNCSLYIPCSSSPCHNGATCANDRKGFKCVCPPYYTGVQCDVMFGCASNPCLQGTCVDIPGSYICNCPVTFTGQNCETFLQCSSSPCQNEATCTNNLIQNSYTCSCSQNFTGAKCETRIPCTLSPCLNNGVCVNEITGYRCNCTGTYEGKNCQTNLPCKSSPCINGGTCLNNGNTFICQNCDAPYRGLRCEILDPCGYHTPCNTGGSRLCNNVGSTFQCLCQPGYTGVRCETYLPCFTSPCLNGGTCTNLPKGYVCNCLSNFGGRNCETSNPCGSNPCQNNGVCFNNGLDYTCQCMQDFTGSRCESLLPCAKQPCVNGTCINQDLFVHKCSCSTGYTGQRCETAVLVCDNSTCVNGMCQTVQGKMTCICYSGFAGSQCDRVRSQCDLQPCQHSGICQNSGTSYMCTCTVAYTGQDCETRVRACDQQPCFNGATCNNLADSYNCTCTAEYTGPSCQSKILPCDSAPCQNNATCTDVDTGYSCHCTERYKGSQCEERISACESTPCQNNGYCLVTGDTYTCACQPPFSGQNCEIEIKTCVPNPCRQGGTCFVDPLGVYCFCHSGFDGILCEKDKGKCNPNPCLNNGVCFQVLGQAKCDCANGFSGDTCQTPVVGCSPDPCNGGGCVEDGHGRFQCKCSPGRFGAQCQLVDPCFVVPCKNRGECKRASDASYECTCTTGYSGATCETLLPACTRSPCQNGASCSDGGSLTSYTCVCATGFTGSDCSTNIDDCNRHACQNGAACVDRINSYSCDCSPGFSGQFCADRDSCSNGPCVRGNCRGVPNSQYGTQYTCDCPQNYYGANCQSYNFCYLVPCRNGAFCKNEAANYKCTCSAGYTGATCEQLIDNCVGVVCQNGGSCVNQLLGYSCQCEGSYFGRHCELSDACSGKPCGNNGVCTSLDNSTSNLRFQCNCINNYTGDLCQQVDYCNTAQCGPGSVCQLTTTGFICVCPAGLTGSNCEVDIDDCNPNPCHHSGTCTDQVNGYTCDCLAPYSGSQCTVTPCSASPCGTVPGTKCNIADFSYTCSCPIGWKGKTCSQSISIITPGFNSDGYLSYIKTYVNNQVSIRLTFSTNTTTGILAYAESGNFYHGIFIDSGRVFFRMQNGFSTDLILRSIASYNNGELYTVFVEQNSTHIRMNVALETIATTHMSPAAIGTWTVYLGGRPDVTSVSNLTGCIHELEISGQSVNLVSDAFQGYNVDSCYQPVCPGVSCSNRGTCEERDGNLYECVCQSGFSGHDCQFSDCDFNPCQRGSCHMEAAGRRCHCPLGYAGPDCSLVTRVNITAFRASSHIKYCNLAKSTQLRQSYMMLKFRTETDNGLLLYMSNGLVPSGDFFSLAIVNRRLQLKFNVGGGDGTLMSKPLPLDTWLTAIVERNGSQAQLTVEGYSTSNGAATGSLQDLNVDGCVYIGGTPDMIVVGPRTDSSQGLTGCLLNLQINDVEYSPAMAVSGADISQCNADLCNSTVNPCVYGSCISSPGAYTCNCDAQHHGLNCEFLKDGCHQNSQCLQGSTCIPTGTGFLCSCLLQFTGAFCNETQDLQKVVPFFRGLSYLEFSPPTGVASITNIQLTFRTGSSNGLLLYMSQGTKVGDFLSVGITSGSIEVHMNLGSGVLVLKGPPIQLHQWYTANMRRRGRTVSLVLGDQELTAVATGTSQGLSVSSNLLLGGAPDYNQLNADVGFLQGFIGCIQELKIGGATVTEITWNDAIGGRGISQCSHSPCTSMACSGRGRCQVISDASYTCLCAVGYSGQTCSLATVIDRPLFNRDGHLSLSRVLTNPRQTNISVELRPLSDSGSILYNTKDADFIALELDNGFVKFSYNLGTGTGLLVSRQPLVMDTWHTITASRSSRNGQLVVNNANVVQGSSPPGGVSMDYNDITYIGGLPTNIAPSNQDFLIAGFHGCIRKLVVESRVVDMTTPAGGYGISQCPIRYCESPQCTAGSTCLENDKSLSGYSCQCPPGVAGTYCNMTVCEVHPGNTMCQNGGSCYMDNGSAKCLCLLGFKDNTCSTVSTFNLAKFTSSRSFLAYNSSDIIRSRHSFAVEIIFKTSLSTGLLLWYGKPNDDYIAVGIEGGQIQCIIKLDSQPSTTFTLQPAVNRDEYFLLKIERLESSLSLTLQSMVGDKTQGSWSLQGQDTQLDTQDDKVYIGGVHGDVQSRTSGHFVSPFSGCIAQLKFGNLQNGQFSYNRVQLQQDAVDGEGIESCVT